MHLIRNILSAGLALAAVGGIAAQAPKAPAVVKWDKASPAGGNGKVTATGTYTAEDGWQPVTIRLWLIPKGGGRTLEAKTAEAADGKWGPITIDRIPAGEYTATISVLFRHEKRGEVTINTDSVGVKVP